MELNDYVGRHGVLNEAFKETAGKNYEMHYGHLVKVKRNYAGVFPLQVVVLSNKGKPHFDVKPNEIDLLDDNDPIIKFKVGEWYDHHFNKGVIQMIDYKYRKMELKYSDGSSEVVDVPTVNQTPKRETVDLEDTLYEMYGNETEENATDSPVDADMIIHKQLLEGLHELIKAKRSDYGDSFGKQYDEYGILSALIRLDDKLNRLKSLTIHAKTQQVNDESLYDTVKDLMGYASLLLLRLEKEKMNAN